MLGETNCQPVLKWGQNNTHIFLTMKLSHRWDSPPCLYTQKEHWSVINDSLEYVNVCVVSHQRLNFNLKFEFYQSVFNDY